MQGRRQVFLKDYSFIIGRSVSWEPTTHDTRQNVFTGELACSHFINRTNGSTYAGFSGIHWSRRGKGTWKVEGAALQQLHKRKQSWAPMATNIILPRVYAGQLPHPVPRTFTGHTFRP